MHLLEIRRDVLISVSVNRSGNLRVDGPRAVDSRCHGAGVLVTYQCLVRQEEKQRMWFPDLRLLCLSALNLKPQMKCTFTTVKSKMAQEEHWIMWTNPLGSRKIKQYHETEWRRLWFSWWYFIKGWLPFILMREKRITIQSQCSLKVFFLPGV